MGVRLLFEDRFINGMTPISVPRRFNNSAGTSVFLEADPGGMPGIVNVPVKSVNVVE